MPSAFSLFTGSTAAGIMRAPPQKVKFSLDSRVPPQPRSFAKKVKYSLFANSEREAAAEPVPLI